MDLDAPEHAVPELPHLLGRSQRERISCILSSEPYTSMQCQLSS
jgi:hypothetical protein